jgi:predicted site-specific integrase-resolvase
MMLMASFSGKLYGKRSVKRKKELKEEKLKLQQLKEKNEQPVV